MTIGDKRNKLMDMAIGKYVAFIDDDDEVADYYIEDILNAIDQEPDVVGISGVMRWKTKRTRTVNFMFYHTIRNKKWWKSSRGFERCPNHLNPIRSDIARRFKFESLKHGEDQDWSQKLQESGLLVTEWMLSRPVYYYNYDPFKEN